MPARSRADRVEPALVGGGLEQRACVDAVRGGYELLASSCEKSISASASSIRRRWSSPVSDLRVTFSAAISERLGDLAADLAEGLLGRLVDLPGRLLEPARAVLLDLLAHALALRVGDLAGLAEDALGLALGVRDQLAVLLEQVACLLAGAVGLLDRLADAVAAVVDHLLDGPERVALEHPQADDERDDRPDHEARDDLDQWVRREHDLHQDVAEESADEAVEHDCLGERESEPHQALELAAQLRLAGDGLDHGAEDVADAGAGSCGAQPDAEREGDRLAGADDGASWPSARAERCWSIRKVSLVFGLDRRADVDGGQGGEDERLDRDDDDDLEDVEDGARSRRAALRSASRTRRSGR